MSLVNDICRSCEYFYRKGARDAAFNGDRVEVDAVINREIFYNTFQFLDDDVKLSLGQFRLHMDEVIVMVGKIKANELRNYLRLAIGSNSMKINICSILDYYYRKGLKDGLKSDKLTCRTFFEEVNKGFIHEKLLDKGRFTQREYMDMVKYHINRIHIARKEGGISSTMCALSTLFAKEMMDKRHEYKS